MNGIGFIGRRITIATISGRVQSAERTEHPHPHIRAKAADLIVAGGMCDHDPF